MEYEWDKNNVEIKIIGENLDDVNIKNIHYFFSIRNKRNGRKNS